LNAGFRTIVDSVDLARLEISEFLSGVLSNSLLLGAAAVLVCGAWFGFMAAATVLLTRWLSWPASLGSTATLNALAGGTLFFVAFRHVRDTRGATLRDRVRNAVETSTGKEETHRE
jgi:protein-S-isoprenylcysteine O-methyltransferase Ste14